MTIEFAAGQVTALDIKLDPLYYQEPHVPERAISFPSCYHFSYCFRPFSSFTPSHLTLWCRTIPPTPPPPIFNVGFYTADALGMPLVLIGNGIGDSSSLVPTWTAVRIPIICSPLTLGQNYAFAVGFDDYPPMQRRNRLSLRMGMNDTCPPPIAEDYRMYSRVCFVSDYQPCNCSGVPWYPYTSPGYNYYMEAT